MDLGQEILGGIIDVPGQEHFIKDMDIALQEAEGFGLHMQVLEEVRKMYAALAQEGKENLGTQALYQYYEQQEK